MYYDMSLIGYQFLDLMANNNPCRVIRIIKSHSSILTLHKQHLKTRKLWRGSPYLKRGFLPSNSIR